MKVLVLGGTGFIGRHLTKTLLEARHELAVFHRGKSAVRFPRRVLHIHGNRSRLGESARAFASFSPDVVVDLIAFTEADAESAVQVFGGRIERLICASSMDVYQAYGAFLRLEISKPRDGPLSEDSPLRTTLFPYRARAKNKGDMLFDYEKILVERTIINSNAFSATILRLPQVFGPHDSQHRLRDYLERMAAGKDILISRAKARWRWTRGYVEDIAAGFALAVSVGVSAGSDPKRNRPAPVLFGGFPFVVTVTGTSTTKGMLIIERVCLRVMPLMATSAGRLPARDELSPPDLTMNERSFIVSPMPQVPADPLLDRRAQILEAAIVCFAKRGFHQTSMHDISAEAGISVGLIYRYFANKEAVISAMADRHKSEIQELLERAQQAPTLFESLEILFTAHCCENSPKVLSAFVVDLYAEASRNPQIADLVRDVLDTAMGGVTNLIARSPEAQSGATHGLQPPELAELIFAVARGMLMLDVLQPQEMTAAERRTRQLEVTRRLWRLLFKTESEPAYA